LQASQTVRPSHVIVRAIGGARYSRVQAAPDELIRLDDGELELSVHHLGIGDRFRVITGDAEVEVRGTRFRVVAIEQRLVTVFVWQGRVDVRPFGGGLAVLEAGDERNREPRHPVDESSSAPGVSRERQRKRGTSAQAGGRSLPPAVALGPSGKPRPAERSHDADSEGGRPADLFDRGWRLLRQGDVAQAATAFEKAQRLAEGTPLEEDALYWRAVAAGRSKDQRATGLLAEFLGRFPSSPRAGAAAVALGWLRLAEGKTDEARALFERAVADPATDVKVSAREGLRRISDQAGSRR
jgi:TolA-binding protein